MIAKPLSQLILGSAMWSVERFYDVGRVGDPVPEGPVLVIANHPNSLMDALVIMKIAGRRVRPLAKAPLFQQAIIGHVLNGLGALPVYRPQDFPGETLRNEDTFKAAVEALVQHEAVLVFPEGLSHSEAELARIKTGAARIALRAEDATGWQLGLRITPVGLTYQRKHAFRGRVAATVGRCLDVGRWRADRAKDEWGAVESLTAAMREALEEVTLTVPTEEEAAIIDAAERLYSTEKKLVRPRERAALAKRLPRLQRFAEAVAWLHTEDPDRYASLKTSVRNYGTRLSLLGVGEGDLPERFPLTSLLRYALVEGLLLLVGLPLAAIGTVAWYLPFQSPRVTLQIYRPAYEAVATVKLATALLAFPVTFGLWLAAAWFVAGLTGLALTAVLLPVAGTAALHWRTRWGIVREDARIFWRTARRRNLREQLVARREALVGEFDEVNRLWRDAHGKQPG